jgi:plastocyanin
MLMSFSACSSPPPVPEAAARLKGEAPPATGGYASVVMFTPEAGAAAPTSSEAALMDQYGTAFRPKLLVVRPGQPVDFKNSEDVLHNVHVVEAETRRLEFNVATPVVGAYRHVFEQEGAYDVSCNIHPSMAAFLIVTTAPYVAVADSAGRFELDPLPEGVYDVRVWNLDPARRLERKVTIGPAPSSLALTPS